MGTTTIMRLEETLLVKVAIAVCNTPEVSELLDDRILYACDEDEVSEQKETWQALRIALQEKVSSLNMSSVLEELLMQKIRDIVVEVNIFVDKNIWYYGKNEEKIMKNLQWSPDGKISYEFTVYKIMEDKDPSQAPKHQKMELLYRLNCKLSNRIPDLL